MSYSKSIYYIPIWFDDFKRYTAAIKASSLWEVTEPDKITPNYLYPYAAKIASNSDQFVSFTLKAPESLHIYMFEDEMQLKHPPIIEQVRICGFATGVGFMEFWLSYPDYSVDEIANFAYLFKKAAKKTGKPLADNKQALYDAAKGILPVDANGELFFAASARFKYECNCLHFVHIDQPIPEEATLKNTIYHLCRSYHTSMPTARESAYDMIYEADAGDYWGGSPEGMVNIVYDEQNDAATPEHYYYHTLKPQHLQVDYYFLYLLLLLNQKYSAVQYIRLVADATEQTSREIEGLNKRIIQLKNAFSFNVVSDDRQFQNIYGKMFSILEIKSLLDDVIENENQIEMMENAKHAKADKLSNKYLFGISILSLFSALIDSASYFDRFGGIRSISTTLSVACVGLILVICAIWAIKSIKK